MTLALGVAGLLAVSGLAAEEIPPADLEFFESRIRPLLVERCGSCHSSEAKKVRGNLLLDTREGWARGGDRGPPIVPGAPDRSLLVRAIRYEDPDLQMPPKGKLAEREIRLLERWIEIGAPDPRTGPAIVPEDDSIDIAARRAAHWAWQPIGDPEAPAVERGDWPLDPIDRFIAARLEAAGLEPAPDADRRTWIRRVTFDLTGMPPLPGDVNAFLEDTAPDAHVRVVRRLLASERFGEHWAQRWLDLVRYAETRGHEQDFEIPEAYRYRDYVIRAFNADVPYDVLVTEHVAGDLVAEPRIDPRLRTNESIQGTGFWHLGEATHSPVDIRGDESERVANAIDVFGKTFLGLTLACARCHDHKFDAISTADYYALYGFLQSSGYQLADVSDPVAQGRAREQVEELRNGTMPKLLAAYAARVEHAERTIASALRGAARVLRGDAPAEVASASGVPVETLERWAETVRRSSGDTRSPLEVFAAAAMPREDAATSDGAIEPAMRIVLDRWRARAVETRRAAESARVVATIEEGERNFVRSERAATADDLVIDYDALVETREGWITSGHRFGSGPADIGDVVPGPGSDRPIALVAEEPAARSDLLSDRFTGMLRTPTFEITSDTLWYRFSGKADIFLAVDSHRVVAGPLHGVVKQKLESDGSVRWKSHNVRDYIGHRVHIEFTPRGSFSLERVEFSASEPVDVFRPSGRLVALLERDDVDSVDALAGGIARTLVEAARDLASGSTRDRADRADAARLVNWLLDNDGLLPADGRDEERAIFDAYAARRKEIEETIPAPVRALAMLDGTAEREPIHIRGNHRTREERGVPRRVLTALDPTEAELSTRGSGRLELARRLVSPSNPLVSRVIVNRVWHHLFGRGIVESVDDLGVMGKKPTHPLLLDHLATTFMRDGWSMKRLIERLVLSRTYRMSSRPVPRSAEIDPNNTLLHRMRIRRLQGEAIRDSLLAISGRLDSTMYGPSVRIHITPFMRGNRSPGWSGPEDGNGRRSIYIEVRRNHLSHFLTTFDKPVPFTAIGRRTVSNSPAQSLILLNDPLVHSLSEAWARRLVSEIEGDAARVERAYLEAFARPPEPWELDAALAFLADQEENAGGGGDPVAAWRDLCHTLVNVKEFVWIN